MPVIHLNTENFQKALASSKVAVIDLWAEWCGPCRSMLPIVDKIGEEYNGKALVAKVNVDEEPEIAGQFGVRSIPTFLFFKDGQLAEKHVGTLSESAFKSKIDTLL
ncbi:MAG: thioredoxin [Bacteroidales bacterium]|jgi:thioredoxin 1|nr:thioredoxin [Bacteroidales bacterium]MBQ5403105.1 thioredoxin [Bacteroidales bacterium]MBR6277869.1 thioredoxin [Bacteroidales bacterium]